MQKRRYSRKTQKQVRQEEEQYLQSHLLKHRKQNRLSTPERLSER